jgi:hypothetical protein
VQSVLDSVGEGPIELTLTSKDLNQTRRALDEAGLRAETGQDGTDTLLLPTDQALGARLLLRA